MSSGCPLEAIPSPLARCRPPGTMCVVRGPGFSRPAAMRLQSICPEIGGSHAVMRMFSRRAAIGAGVAAAVAAATAGLWVLRRDGWPDAMPVTAPEMVDQVGTMPMRSFGRTGLQVSEVGFGAWAIGGQSYGPVEKA